jgi:predicted PurR-regulated permease PerM
MTKANRFDKILGIGMLAALVIGCLLVLLPFVTALLMAAILTYSTWPVYVGCMHRSDRAIRVRGHEPCR